MTSWFVLDGPLSNDISVELWFRTEIAVENIGTGLIDGFAMGRSAVQGAYYDVQ